MYKPYSITKNSPTSTCTRDWYKQYDRFSKKNRHLISCLESSYFRSFFSMIWPDHLQSVCFLTIVDHFDPVIQIFSLPTISKWWPDHCCWRKTNFLFPLANNRWPAKDMIQTNERHVSRAKYENYRQDERSKHVFETISSRSRIRSSSFFDIHDDKKRRRVNSVLS